MGYKRKCHRMSLGDGRDSRRPPRGLSPCLALSWGTHPSLKLLTWSQGEVQVPWVTSTAAAEVASCWGGGVSHPVDPNRMWWAGCHLGPDGAPPSPRRRVSRIQALISVSACGCSAWLLPTDQKRCGGWKRQPPAQLQTQRTHLLKNNRDSHPGTSVGKATSAETPEK